MRFAHLSQNKFFNCQLREGFKKKMVEFNTKRPPWWKRNRKTKNDLCVMKQILYDMGPLTLVRWPLYRALMV